MSGDSFKEFVQDQLQKMEGVRCRRMFGGFGVYQDEIFFGIISHGQLFFKTDASTREQYLSKGMAPFRPSEKMILKSYYEVPADILDDPDLLADWAKQAIRSQVSDARSTKRPRRKIKTSR